MKSAIIMSKEEAMALPLKERPICFRISSEMYHDVFEKIGEASMCWNPRPGDSVFASEQASDVAVRLCFTIADEVEAARRDALRMAESLVRKQIKDIEVGENIHVYESIIHKLKILHDAILKRIGEI